ncbi:DNA-(apurinic or apyrimidinic site) endonuclease 2 [[Candida] jaroonii]|uniref:DNA-(Apurinic or apyrimidinic site) endonuclease 2 n=1 Tax=[Candida] jaroonii TaxID=467808 RepID=A0ACA9Y5B2_9ASCO|nr:DNA-(apurinic or apyrimidinic site) endonuclease 2 [[Candida] jaroonii]
MNGCTDKEENANINEHLEPTGSDRIAANSEDEIFINERSSEPDVKDVSTGSQDVLSKIDSKDHGDLRVVSFNVNGIKTLFNYHPWNNKSLQTVLQDLKADIISLQELKLDKDSINDMSLKNYRSFVTIPKLKKGYSGVGLFVRIPKDEESDLVKYNLNVVRAEEGLTGFLKVNKARFKDLDGIGGYPDMEEEEALKIDSEGRSIVIELSNNLVIFSLYCPANSMGSEEGADFKLKFTKILLERCKNLKEMGKEVMIVGDINVSLDLIDRAENISDLLKQKRITYHNEGIIFEQKNLPQCMEFKFSSESRELLNKYVHPTIGDHPGVKFDTQFLYDTTRVRLGRKMGVYTVWNTMKNSRQTNFGSRIDLILSSSKNFTKSNVWPFLNGSDHCPIFTDFKMTQNGEYVNKKLEFEVKNFYKLVRHHDISTMFKSVKRKQPNLVDSEEKAVYKSRKKNDQPGISTFFASKSQIESQKQIEMDIASQANIYDSSNHIKPGPQKNDFRNTLEKPPNCNHGIPCQLKTSLNTKSRGKKFWCCSKQDSFEDGNCNYFKWFNK